MIYMYVFNIVELMKCINILNSIYRNYIIEFSIRMYM